MEVMVIPILIGTLGSHQKIGTGTGGIWNKRTSGDHYYEWRLYYFIIEIGQNTEKSPRDLKKLAVTETLVKDLKNSQRVNSSNNDVCVCVRVCVFIDI